MDVSWYVLRFYKLISSITASVSYHAHNVQFFQNNCTQQNGEKRMNSQDQEKKSPNDLLRKVLDQIGTIGAILLQEDKKVTKKNRENNPSAPQNTRGLDDITNLGTWLDSGGNADLLGLWIQRNRATLLDHGQSPFIKLLEEWQVQFNCRGWDHQEGRTVLNAISDAAVVQKIEALKGGNFTIETEVEGGQGNLALQDIQYKFKFLAPEPTLVEKVKILYQRLTPIQLLMLYAIVFLLVALFGVLLLR